MTNSPAEFYAAFREFVASEGVEYDTDKPANFGKNFSYIAKSSQLQIRATADELDKIAAAVESLNRPRSWSWKTPSPHPPRLNPRPLRVCPSNSLCHKSGAVIGFRFKRQFAARAELL